MRTGMYCQRKLSTLLIALLGAVFLLTSVVGQVTAETKPAGFPNRPLTIIVPYSVGGPTDIYVRTVAQGLSKIIGVDVKVVNITGGQGVPAFTALINEPADGHSLLAIGDGDIINTVRGLYDIREVIPVARCQQDQSVIWVPTNSKFKDFKDVIEHAKANPGVQRWCGGVDYDEVVVPWLASAAGIKIKYVPYKSGADAFAALAGGFFDVGHDEISAQASLFAAGKIRPILVLTAERLPRYPDIPTAREYGIDLVSGRWRGLGVKKGTPEDVLDYLTEAIKQALETEEYKKLARTTVTDQVPGFVPWREMLEIVKRDLEAYSKLMKELGLVK